MNFSRLTLVKLVELALGIIILWLHYKTYEADSISEIFVMTATYAGFCIIILGTFLGQIFGHPVNRTMDMFFCVVGAILYIASGSMSINHFRGWRFSSEKENLGITLGSLAIVQGALFILDAFFVFRFE